VIGTLAYQASSALIAIGISVLIRSYEELDFPLAWGRVLNWAQGGTIDLPDRLPFEVLARLYGNDGPRPPRQHHLSPVTLVMSSKKSGTSRPFTRLNPIDLTLYQALIDRLAPDIDRALPGRDVVMAYRQTLEPDQVHAFNGTPSRAAYEDRIQEMFSAFDGMRYAITADITGFFLHIGIDELEHRLYAASTQIDAVRDVLDLLKGWQTLGIRGLPQGIRPSSPLANLFLTPIDELLASLGIPYVRWMDDWVIGASGFHAAREIQDEVERSLYGIGLTLASDKTRIVRAGTAVQESESAKHRLSLIKRARQETIKDLVTAAQADLDYPADDVDLPDPGEIDRDASVITYAELLGHLDDDDLPNGFRPMVTEILRDLGSLRHAYALQQIPRLLERAPDLTGEATKYLARVSKGSAADVKQVFATLLAADRFAREYEKLAMCQGMLALRVRTAMDLAPSLGRWALEDKHELVRARALLAWGAQSPKDEFDVVDAFWAKADAPWRPYALVAIQSKTKAARNDRYDRWSGEGRFLGQLATALRKSTLGWRKL